VTPEELTKAVNSMLKEGWEPFGNPFFAPNVNGAGDKGQPESLYQQAMVRFL
jgi:hypothetical protein